MGLPVRLQEREEKNQPTSQRAATQSNRGVAVGDSEQEATPATGAQEETVDRPCPRRESKCGDSQRRNVAREKRVGDLPSEEITPEDASLRLDLAFRLGPA